jgi:hypothetical protein
MPVGRAQNAAKGGFQKQKITLVDSGQIYFTDYSNTTAVMTADSTGAVFEAGIKISDKQGLTANSTGLVFGNPDGSLPGNVDNGVLFGLISNSTGVAAFINSTGTTHKYLNVTTLQPT